MIKNDNFKFDYMTSESGYKNPLSDTLDTADPCIVY